MFDPGVRLGQKNQLHKMTAAGSSPAAMTAVCPERTEKAQSEATGQPGQKNQLRMMTAAGSRPTAIQSKEFKLIK